jgi:hypothetical protein
MFNCHSRSEAAFPRCSFQGTEKITHIATDKSNSSKAHTQKVGVERKKKTHSSKAPTPPFTTVYTPTPPSWPLLRQVCRAAPTTVHLVVGRWPPRAPGRSSPRWVGMWRTTGELDGVARSAAATPLDRAGRAARSGRASKREGRTREETDGRAREEHPRDLVGSNTGGSPLDSHIHELRNHPPRPVAAPQSPLAAASWVPPPRLAGPRA